MKKLALLPIIALAFTAACNDNPEGLLAPEEASFNKGSTNQNVTSSMFDIDIDGTFQVVDEETWSFSATTAKRYFTNAQTTDPVTVQCTRGTCPTPAPDAPPAPAPKASELNSHVSECNFWAGGTLPTKRYTQTNKIDGGTGKSSWTYTYTYTYAVAPTQASVDPKTAWTLVNAEHGDPATLDISGFIASQSVQKRTGSFKTSHTVAGRIENLKYTLYSVEGLVETLVETNSLAHTVASGQNFGYTATQVSNASLAHLLISNNSLVSDIQQGKVGNTATPQDFDNFAGNDNVGAEQAVITPVSIQLPGAGNYKVVVEGRVKGVDGAVDSSFTVTRNITFNGVSCTL